MKKSLPIILVILIFIAGISVFLYPTISNYLYQKNSTRAITEHTEILSQLSPERIAEEKEAIRRYNISLFKNSVVLTDPFDPDAYPITDGEYDELLAFDDIMAYIEIPAIDVYLPIYHGTSEEVLLIGAAKAPTLLFRPTAVSPLLVFSRIFICLKKAVCFVFMFLTKR